MYPVTYLYLCLTAGLVSLLLIPPVFKLALRIGGIDHPDHRKQHQKEIPRLGGIAIFVGCLFSLLTFTSMPHAVKSYLVGGSIIFATGLADDIYGLRPLHKLIGQFVAALVVVISGGVCLASLGDLLGLGEIRLGFLALPFTIFAIVGITNAINLLDGLDGLAGGVTAVVSATICLLAWQIGNHQLLMISTALLGGVLGFLKYNTYPAKIFMGDSGSLFIGYSLGVCSVLLVTGSGDRISPMVPVLMLSIPIFDTLFVMGNRLRKGQPLFYPDRSHIHHRLLDLGLGHAGTVQIVYGVTYLFCLLAFFQGGAPDGLLLLQFLGISIALYLMLKILMMTEGLERFKAALPIFDPSFMTMRRLVDLSNATVSGIKYLLIAVLVLSVAMPAAQLPAITAAAGLLLVATMLFACFSSRWSNLFLQGTIYTGSALLIFLMENTGRTSSVFDLPLHRTGFILYGLLTVLIVVQVLIRRRFNLLTSTPFEYFILFILVVIPLLPEELVAQYHLFAVTLKAIVVFIAYKLILMDDVVRNRKIILALGVGLCGYLVKTVQ